MRLATQAIASSAARRTTALAGSALGAQGQRGSWPAPGLTRCRRQAGASPPSLRRLPVVHSTSPAPAAPRAAGAGCTACPRCWRSRRTAISSSYLIEQTPTSGCICNSTPTTDAHAIPAALPSPAGAVVLARANAALSELVQTSSVVECRRRGWSRRRSGSRRAPAAWPAVDCSFAPGAVTSAARIASLDDASAATRARRLLRAKSGSVVKTQRQSRHVARALCRLLLPRGSRLQLIWPVADSGRAVAVRWIRERAWGGSRQGRTAELVVAVRLALAPGGRIGVSQRPSTVAAK